MFKKTVIAIFLLSFTFAQDAVELEENKHFNSYQKQSRQVSKGSSEHGVST